jgi:hypothetical protein
MLQSSGGGRREFLFSLPFFLGSSYVFETEAILLEIFINFFLGAFEKLRKAIISFIMSVCPVRIEQLGSNWTDFYETLYLRFFQKLVEAIQISLEYDKNDGLLT